MDKLKLRLITANPKSAKLETSEWFLDKEKYYTLGRSLHGCCVDIDLASDRTVSPLHAVINREERRWWIRSESKYGIRLNSTPVAQGKAVSFKEYDVICLGKRACLLCVAAQQEVLYWKGFWIVLDLAAALNYALLYSGLPFIRKIVLYNGSNRKSKTLPLQIKVGDYYQKDFTVPMLEPTRSYELKDLNDFKVYPELFRDQTASLTFYLKSGTTVIWQQEINRMSFNTWLKETEPHAWLSLASFVLPNHSYVVQVTEKLDLQAQPVPTGLARQQLERLYGYFTNDWQIRFKEELSSAGINTQQIRLPHHILYDWERRQGEGNCLDLSLLFASCLENLRLNPLIVILELDKVLWHALVGIRAEDWLHSNPLLRHRDELIGEILVFDPNSITAGLDFRTAVEQGTELLRQKCFLFALDISKAREYDIQPLPFESMPRESPAVIQIDIAARDLAESMHPEYRVCSTIHVLIAMLTQENGFTTEICKSLGLNCEKAINQLLTGLRNIHADQVVEKLSFSRNYKLLLPQAASLAKENHSLFIMEEHLLLSLLNVKSASLDRAITDLGIRKEELKTRISELITSQTLEQPDDVKSFYNNKKWKLFFF